MYGCESVIKRMSMILKNSKIAKLNSRYMSFLKVVENTEGKCAMTTIFSHSKCSLLAIQSFMVGIHKMQRMHCKPVVVPGISVKLARLGGKLQN